MPHRITPKIQGYTVLTSVPGHLVARRAGAGDRYLGVLCRSGEKCPGFAESFRTGSHSAFGPDEPGRIREHPFRSALSGGPIRAPERRNTRPPPRMRHLPRAIWRLPHARRYTTRFDFWMRTDGRSSASTGTTAIPRTSRLRTCKTNPVATTCAKRSPWRREKSMFHPGPQYRTRRPRTAPQAHDALWYADFRSTGAQARHDHAELPGR